MKVLGLESSTKHAVILVVTGPNFFVARLPDDNQLTVGAHFMKKESHQFGFGNSLLFMRKKSASSTHMDPPQQKMAVFV